MVVPERERSRKTLLGGAVRKLTPRARELVGQALAGAVARSRGMPRRLLRVLEEALREGDPAQVSARLRSEGGRWAEEERSVATLAKHAVTAVRLLGTHFRSLQSDDVDGAELVRLAFLSEVLTGYVEAREELAVQRRSAEFSARMNELAAMHKVISAANSSLDLDATLHLVVQTVAEVMLVDVCELYLFEPERGTLVLGASVGLNPEATGRLRFNLGRGVTGWAAQEGRPMAVPDVSQEPRFFYQPSLHEDPYRSLLSVPIVLYTVEKLVGVINVRTREVRTYTPEEINFLEMVAGEMAMSVENARLYQDTDQRLRQKVDELTTLQRVSAMVVSTLDQQCLQQEELYVQVASAGRPVVIREEGEEKPFEAVPRPLLCIPLRGKEGALGAICLHTQRREGFAPEQVDLLTVFADQAALALENARLYSESRRSLEMKSTLLQEMHHRVRNNLQAVASLLNMQMRRVRDREVVRYLGESAARVQSIAAVHDLLCEETLGITTVQAVAWKVLEVARAHLSRPGLELGCQIVEEPPLLIGSKEATLLALVVNELFSNAVSHGFGDQDKGTVIADAYLAGDHIVLQVKDDGLGPDEGVEDGESGLGLQIIRALITRDLGGTFSLQRDGAWTVAIVTLPYHAPQQVEP
jgi:two-component sensor histidine kinase/putative methionine-R-sulfoxide reductase with GAF domain